VGQMVLYLSTNCREGIAGCATTIDSEKLQMVASLFQSQVDWRANTEVVRFAICTWDNGPAHQDWIDSAHPQEITDWLEKFYEGCTDGPWQP